MQVWFIRISGISKFSDHITTFNTITNFHFERSWNKVCITCEYIIA